MRVFEGGKASYVGGETITVVAVTVCVYVGVGAVVVIAETLMHEQAEEYLTLPKQEEA
jgi:hypothetical protein